MSIDNHSTSNLPGQAFWLSGCALALLLGVAVLFRFDALGNVPGVNGDEAWMGAQAEALLHGEPVTWRTPTGNWINPFHFLPQVALHAVAKPSIALLRTTVLLSGLSALVLNFFLARRLFDWQIAIVSTALLALLPVNIAYARFGWDASQTVLFTLPVVYFSLLALKEANWKYWPAAIAALFAAVLVHPTNVFIAPMLIVPAVAAYRVSLTKALDYRANPLLASAVSMPALFALLASAWLLRPWLAIAAGRACDLAQWRSFSVLYLDFLSGTTIYRFVGGRAAEHQFAATGGRLFVLAVLVAAGIGIVRQWQDDNASGRRLLVPLLLGYSLTLLGFFLIAGPEAIQPHFERYAMCLIAGIVPIVAIGCRPLLFQPAGRTSAVLRWSALAVASLWLLSFQLNYFAAIRGGSGESHLAFRTGGIDPKQAALEEIVAQRSAGRSTVIIAGEWWNYWPLKYLAYRYDNIEVRGLGTPIEAAQELLPGAGPSDVWFVEFYGSPAARETKQLLEQAGYRVKQKTFTDYSGSPIVEATHPVAVSRHGAEN